MSSTSNYASGVTRLPGRDVGVSNLTVWEDLEVNTVNGAAYPPPTVITPGANNTVLITNNVGVVEWSDKVNIGYSIATIWNTTVTDINDGTNLVFGSSPGLDTQGDIYISVDTSGNIGCSQNGIYRLSGQLEINPTSQFQGNLTFRDVTTDVYLYSGNVRGGISGTPSYSVLNFDFISPMTSGNIYNMKMIPNGIGGVVNCDALDMVFATYTSYLNIELIKAL